MEKQVKKEDIKVQFVKENLQMQARDQEKKKIKEKILEEIDEKKKKDRDTRAAQAFSKWLRDNSSSLSNYSIRRYIGAIDTITKSLQDYKVREDNLYYLEDITIIDDIIKNKEFKKKNNKENRMYSAALNHLKSYIQNSQDKEFLTELMNEREQFISYMTRDKADSPTIVDMPQKRPEYKEVYERKIWKRNSRYAAEAITAANYLCEIDKQHQHFISKFSKENYVEAHHLIPMKFQHRFNKSLDVHANIVSICPVCHKKLHHGYLEEKKKLLCTLFNDRKERLAECKIKITLEELYSCYKD